jgi:hypothetical protein
MRWALSYVERFGKPLGAYAAANLGWSPAWFASRDPAKLVELMAMALRARGVHCIVAVYFGCDDTMIQIGDRVFTMPQARTMLAAIMATIADDFSKWQCERIIRNET